jgi:hypothetical protein
LGATDAGCRLAHSHAQPRHSLRSRAREGQGEAEDEAEEESEEDSEEEAEDKKKGNDSDDE